MLKILLTCFVDEAAVEITILKKFITLPFAPYPGLKLVFTEDPCDATGYDECWIGNVIEWNVAAQHFDCIVDMDFPNQSFERIEAELYSRGWRSLSD